MHHPTDRIAHTTAFVTPVVDHWLEREIAQWVHPTKDQSDDPSHHVRTLLPRSYIKKKGNEFLSSWLTHRIWYLGSCPTILRTMSSGKLYNVCLPSVLSAGPLLYATSVQQLGKISSGTLSNLKHYSQDSI